MLSFLFIAYIVFIAFLIARNYKSHNVIWLCIMLAGFCMAFFGLASYTEYISSSVYYTDSKMFKNVSKYIWILNYYLNLDILNDYRIMNIGVALYIYGAVCFPLSYIKSHMKKKYLYLALAVLPALIAIFYDPDILAFVLGLSGKDYFSEMYSMKNYIQYINIISYVFNIIIKIFIAASIAIFLHAYRKIIPILHKKFVYMIFGIVPVHVLFFSLFFWFPNHKIIFARYAQLTNFSLHYNEFVYGFITYFAFFSILLVIFAMLKYNVFEISTMKDRINFQKQLNTAHVGLKVFSHSIKNQIIAIKLLTEQLAYVSDEERKRLIIQDITQICENSIEKLGASFKETGVVKLRYEIINVDDVIKSIISKHKKVNNKVVFTYESQSDLRLCLDIKQFEKVLDNIIINALEACNRSKQPKIKIGMQEKVNYGVISVEDNGFGISKRNIKKVFEPFFSTKPMSSNWGIGLSHCQKVVEAFGGAIQIQSKENEGTIVDIYIPMNRR